MLYSKPELMKMVLDKGGDELACAVIHVLSQWQPNTLNVIISDNFLTFTEEGSYTTWGLFQFTGQQARQYGYKEDFNKLQEAEINIDVGLGILKSAMAMSNNRPQNGLLFYLGRSRAMLIPSILSLLAPYQELISQRPIEKASVSDPAPVRAV